MYRHILIPTDGSELAVHGVAQGLALAKSLGAKVTVILVEERAGWLPFAETGAAEAFAKYTEEIKQHYTSALDRVANMTKQISVPCDNNSGARSATL